MWGRRFISAQAYTSHELIFLLRIAALEKKGPGVESETLKGSNPPQHTRATEECVLGVLRWEKL